VAKARGCDSFTARLKARPFKTDPSMRFLLPQNPEARPLLAANVQIDRFWIWEKMGVEVPFALLTPRIIFKSVRCCGHGK
jgi:hypothetical protein